MYTLLGATYIFKYSALCLIGPWNLKPLAFPLSLCLFWYSFQYSEIPFQTQYYKSRYECLLISIKMEVCSTAYYSPYCFPLVCKRRRQQKWHFFPQYRNYDYKQILWPYRRLGALDKNKLGSWTMKNFLWFSPIPLGKISTSKQLDLSGKVFATTLLTNMHSFCKYSQLIVFIFL